MKNGKNLLLVALFSAVIFGFQGVLFAIDIAYIYGNTTGQDSVIDYLNGNFDSVTPIDGDANTLPTLDELMSYDAIMVSPNWEWTDPGRPSELGDLLADYVDSGGGLVMTTFSWQYPDINGLSGRLLSGGHSPFVGGSSLYSYSSFLGDYASHPIMNGINSIVGYYRDDVVASGDAQIIAYWGDGVPFVAIDKGSGVIGINLFPEDNFGDVSGDYVKLFVNALNWAASQHPKNKWGGVITIDGMNMGASFFPGWSDLPTAYLYEAIDQDWRDKITLKIGPVYPFAWSRNTSKTSEAVERLYGRIKDLNRTGGRIVILAHSWGSVLAYLALMEHDDIYIDKLITIGSPLESAYLPIYYYTKDKLEDNGVYSVSKLGNLGQWHNYYTTCDLIGGRIPFLKKKNYVNKKLYLTTGLCHSSYFDDEKKWNKILNDVISK